MKILIVEDEAMVAMSLQFLLQVEGHHVVGTADDVASAVAAAEADRPDLAFVDIQLAQGASGFTVAEELRKLNIVCIFLTGNPPPRPMPELALGCLAKPYSDPALTAAIGVAQAVIEGAKPPPPPPGLELY